jgi:hypothetical protein
MSYGVVLFNTTSWAMQAQKALISKGYGVTMIPTPHQITGGCGTCVRFNWYEQEAIKEVMDKAGVEIQSIQEVK